MTVPAQPEQPTEVCEVCGYDRPAHEGDGEMVHAFRLAAPSEPPAADSPTPGTESCCPQGCVVGGCHTWQAPAAPSPVDTEPPAEAQQGDEPVTRGVARALWTQRLAHNPSVRERTAFLSGWDAALAARPSADTETLPGALAQLERVASDECGPLRMVVLDAVASIRAALDGER